MLKKKKKTLLIVLGLATVSTCDESLIRKHAYWMGGELAAGIEISDGVEDLMSQHPPRLVRKTEQTVEVEANGDIGLSVEASDKALVTSMMEVRELKAMLYDRNTRIRDLEVKLQDAKASCKEGDQLKLPHGLLEAGIGETKTEGINVEKHEAASQRVRWAATWEHVKLYYGGDFDLLETDIHHNRKAQAAPRGGEDEAKAWGLETQSPTPSPTPSPTQAFSWYVATIWESCDETCSGLGGVCSDAELAATSSSENTTQTAFLAAGFTCNSFKADCEPSNCARWGAPYLHTSHFIGSTANRDGQAAFCGRGNDVAQCSQRPVDHHHRRLCPCTVTAFMCPAEYPICGRGGSGNCRITDCDPACPNGEDWKPPPEGQIPAHDSASPRYNYIRGTDNMNNGVQCNASYQGCSNTRSPWMIINDRYCENWTYIRNTCNLNDHWRSEKYCQQTCYNLGLGYDGDDCGQATPPTPSPPTPSPPTPSADADFEDYIVTAVNLTHCPAGTYRIETNNACEKAAMLLGYEFMGASTFFMHPRGCAVDLDDKVTHNFVPPQAGLPNEFEKLICARSNTCGTFQCPPDYQHRMDSEDLEIPSTGKCCEKRAVGARCAERALCEREIAELKKDSSFMCDCIYNHEGKRDPTKCKEWLMCLHYQKGLVQVWFKELLEFQREQPLQAASIVQSSDVPEDVTCSDPSTVDLFELDCSCAETLQRVCAYWTDRQQCLKEYACASTEVCAHWKSARCPNISSASLVETHLRIENRAGSAIGTDSTEAVDDSLRLSRVNDGNSLDESVQRKCR